MTLLHFPSVLAAAIECMRCLIHAPGKKGKRFDRLIVLLCALKLAFDKGLLSIGVAKAYLELNAKYLDMKKQFEEWVAIERQTAADASPTIDQLREEPSSGYWYGESEYNFGSGAINQNGPRCVLQNSLTKETNNNPRIYSNGCEILGAINIVFSTHDELRPYYEKQQLFMMAKGGMGQLKSLEQFIDSTLLGPGLYNSRMPEIIQLRKDISKAFGVGDNDAKMHIDPNLPEEEYSEVMKLATNVVEIILDDFSDRMSPDGDLADWYNDCYSFNTVIYDGEELMITPETRAHSDVTSVIFGTCRTPDEDRERHIYSTKNTALKFRHGWFDTPTHFDLLRLKIAMGVFNTKLTIHEGIRPRISLEKSEYFGIYASEFLDISIAHYDSDESQRGRKLSPDEYAMEFCRICIH